MKASSTDHQNQPINAGQKVNNVGNALVAREASEDFLIQIPSLLHPAWQSSPQRIIDLCFVSYRLDLEQRCFPILARLVSQRTHDLLAKPQFKTNNFLLDQL